MSGAANDGGGWKGKLLKAKRDIRRLLRLPLQLFRFLDTLELAKTNAVLQRLYEGNVALQRLFAELLPRLQHDVQAGRREVAQLSLAALPEMQAAATESREELRRLKHRYAEFYGNLVEQMKEQNSRLDRLAEQQERILKLLADRYEPMPLGQHQPRLTQAG
jgi:hypothetical protein